MHVDTYSFTRIVWYDAAFRSTIANNPEMRWDDQFPDGFNSFVIGGKAPSQSQVSCFNCSKPGHYASSCPIKSVESRRFPNPQDQRSPAMQSVPTIVTNQALSHANNFHPSSASLSCPPSQRSQLCNQFNKYGSCMAGCAPSCHGCNSPGCGGDHPGRACPSLYKFQY